MSKKWMDQTGIVAVLLLVCVSIFASSVLASASESKVNLSC
jgi:hypothetical protein